MVAVCIGLLACPRAGAADDLATALYVRTDSDTTTVVSPRARAQRSVGETTTLDATYAVDVWTSASVDIRTSASVRPVTEQRDELDVGVTHELEDLSVHGGYRLSIENDYDSNGVSAGGSYDFADNAATIALSLNAIHDVVGRSGDDDFARSLNTLNSRLTFTQVVDPVMFVELTYEIATLDGYQSSPYRYVGVMGTGFGCQAARQCLSEHVPSTRLRHAFALHARRALSEEIALGATYRFYVDDWALQSHTLLGELGWIASESTVLAFHLRYYTQSAVDFYQAVYALLPAAGAYVTRDRELSAMSSERLGVDLTHRIDFDDGAKTLALSLDVAGAMFQYDDFVGLSSVRALEVTTALVLTL